MAAFLTLKIKMVKAGQGAHLNAILKMLQGASKTGAEFKLVLPTLHHGIVPGGEAGVCPTCGCEGPSSLDNTPYSHKSWTAPGRAHAFPSNDEVQHVLIGPPRVGHVA